MVAECTKEALKWLVTSGLISWQHESSTYTATGLGKAAMASGLAPEEVLQVQRDLEKAREGFVMTTELHLTYLITPLKEDLNPNFQVFYDIWSKLQVSWQ